MGRKGTEGKKQSIIFPLWMAQGIEFIANKNKWTVTDVVLEYVRQGLEADKVNMGIGRQASEPEQQLGEKTA